MTGKDQNAALNLSHEDLMADVKLGVQIGWRTARNQGADSGPSAEVEQSVRGMLRKLCRSQQQQNKLASNSNK